MRIITATIIAFFFLNISFVNGQSRSHKRAIYAEAFGPGILYSVNYDWRFKEDYKGHGARVGVSAVNFSDDGFWVAVPVSYNFIFANNFKTQVEFGAGLTFAFGDIKFADFQDQLVFGHLIAGIRYRPFRNSFFLKAAWTPIIRDEKFRYVFGNIGFGFSY